MSKKIDVENVKVLSKDSNGYITQSAILERGWTKSLINRFLPEPVLKKNPKYACAAPMKLWEEEKVIEVERTDAFIAALTKLEKRRESAILVAHRKRAALVDAMVEAADEVEIEMLDDETLRRAALESQRAWYEYQDDLCGNGWSYHDVENACEDVINRWVVNYIRHNLIDYDEKLRDIKGKIGVSIGYSTYKNLILKRIAQVYPKYAKECYRQIGYT